ncbi:MAG TPA: chemotaxis protein CheD [Paracoccaceae bacterium]|nr:chemotaxis protein CheD [Paracoccaceae bacterium]
MSLALRTRHVIQGDCTVDQDTEVELSTVLGSCVAACLFDPGQRIGGMNHFLLPDDGKPGTDNRYAAAAMERLVNALLKRGASRPGLRAKLFGGARMIPGLPDIGGRNAEAARRFLAAEGITCVATDLGGNEARRVRFRPATGEARVLLLGPAAVIAPERPAARTGAIELF